MNMKIYNEILDTVFVILQVGKDLERVLTQKLSESPICPRSTSCSTLLLGPTHGSVALHACYKVSTYPECLNRPCIIKGRDERDVNVYVIHVNGS